MRFSPLLQVDGSVLHWPSTLVAVGGVETAEFKRQSAEMHAALQRRGVSTAFLEATTRNHFDIVFDLGEPGSAIGACGSPTGFTHGKDHSPRISATKGGHPTFLYMETDSPVGH